MAATVRKAIATALTAAVVGTTIFAAVPAQAGGSVSFNLQPRNAQEDRAMRTGFAVYSIVNAVKSGGTIRQNGTGNAAGLAQNGWGNFGVVHQEGSGHNGTLTQNGNGNSYGLFQFGRNTGSNVTQNGNGGTGATFQFGW